MAGNTAAGSGVDTGIGLTRRANGTASYVFNIQGFTEGSGSFPTADGFIANANPAGHGVTLVSQTTGFGNTSGLPLLFAPSPEDVVAPH